MDDANSIRWKCIITMSHSVYIQWLNFYNKLGNLTKFQGHMKAKILDYLLKLENWHPYAIKQEPMEQVQTCFKNYAIFSLIMRCKHLLSYVTISLQPI